MVQKALARTQRHAELRVDPGAFSRMLILDPARIEDIIRQRQDLGIDHHDEVWDGVYVMPPLANNPHQVLVSRFNTILL